MMTFLRVFALFALASSLISCAGMRMRTARDQRTLILISIDGFRADYLDRGITPNLNALAKDGVRADALRPAFPTLTFPNHYTIVTGLYPDHHGILHNRMEDPNTGERFVYNDASTTANPKWWGGAPIWVNAERHGIRTATMFWPGSNVAIDGVRPGRWMDFNDQIGPEGRVTKVLNWLSLPNSTKPRFITLYFEQIDHLGHHDGPDSLEVSAAIGEIDRAIGHLRHGLARLAIADSTNLVILSDHGMTPAGPDNILFLEDWIALDAVHATGLGIVAGLQPIEGHEAEAERALLAAHEHAQCWRKSEIPPRLHYGNHERVPAIVCLADLGWIITTHADLAKRTHISLGEHGYDNEAPDMRALFIAHGPSFRRGLVVPEFDNVHVYALLARLLGVPAAANDGDPAVTVPMMVR
jgi:predicted AlkP superfamily pyrophosphatase or phosphodiesterase